MTDEFGRANQEKSTKTRESAAYNLTEHGELDFLPSRQLGPTLVVLLAVFSLCLALFDLQGECIWFLSHPGVIFDSKP
jgi:hypothetical protein